jgi:hypothetical protein
MVTRMKQLLKCRSKFRKNPRSKHLRPLAERCLCSFELLHSCASENRMTFCRNQHSLIGCIYICSLEAWSLEE